MIYTKRLHKNQFINRFMIDELIFNNMVVQLNKLRPLLFGVGNKGFNLLLVFFAADH